MRMWGEKFWPAAWQSRWCQLRKRQRRHRQLLRERDQAAGQKQAREWQVCRHSLHNKADSGARSWSRRGVFAQEQMTARSRESGQLRWAGGGCAQEDVAALPRELHRLLRTDHLHRLLVLLRAVLFPLPIPVPAAVQADLVLADVAGAAVGAVADGGVLAQDLLPEQAVRARPDMEAACSSSSSSFFERRFANQPRRRPKKTKGSGCAYRRPARCGRRSPPRRAGRGGPPDGSRRARSPPACRGRPWAACCRRRAGGGRRRARRRCSSAAHRAWRRAGSAPARAAAPPPPRPPTRRPAPAGSPSAPSRCRAPTSRSRGPRACRRSRAGRARWTAAWTPPPTPPPARAPPAPPGSSAA